MKLEFPQQILKRIKILQYLRIHLVGAEWFQADDRRTDMTKLIVAFRNFANAPKN
jgi:hypothetical protein